MGSKIIALVVGPELEPKWPGKAKLARARTCAVKKSSKYASNMQHSNSTNEDPQLKLKN